RPDRSYRKDETLSVLPGQYRRVGRIRTGRAWLSVDVNGHMEYCNRRGEIRVVEAQEFIRIFNKQGVNTKVA
ncbi:MAG TPA: hypothetical protein VFR35_20670, partial [Actinoplanes sp.]|nr:hypothetical protein [Actinoplanes sp.]